LFSGSDYSAFLTEEAHQGIEKSVQMLRDEADRSWQSAIHQVEDIDDRMTKAAKDGSLAIGGAYNNLFLYRVALSQSVWIDRQPF
jgi:hypothetical protein